MCPSDWSIRKGVLDYMAPSAHRILVFIIIETDKTYVLVDVKPRVCSGIGLGVIVAETCIYKYFSISCG